VTSTTRTAEIDRRGEEVAMATTKKTTAASGQEHGGFTDEERAAMKDRAKEVRTRTRRSAAADPEGDVLAKIAELSGSDRLIAEQLHAIVKASAPELTPKLWYGMPAYARDGKVVCFFQSAAKFKARYATLGFSDEANLDDGPLWPASYALTGLTPAAEARIGALIKQAVS
jgi:uncharacterized protein YdhG (YjbR/CyaY superfamily)